MRVLVIHPPLYPVNIDLYNEIGKHVDLSVISIGEHPVFHRSWEINKLNSSVRCFKLWVVGKGKYTIWKSLNPFIIKKVIEEKPDIIVSIAFWLPSFYISLLKNLLNIKLLIFSDATTLSERRISSIKKIYIRVITRMADGLIAASLDSVEYFKSFLPEDKWEKIYLSYHTIDVNLWINAINKLLDKNILRRLWNIDENKIVLLGVGILELMKNWSMSVKLLKHLHENFILVLVGDGSQKENLQCLVKNLHLENRVVFLNRQEGDSLKQIYKLSDVFIFPTISDKFGYVVIEALASGLPVLCSNYAGARCFVKDGYNGFLIDPFEDCSQKVNSIISNINQMKKNAMESISRYTIENRAREFIEIFDRVIK